MKNSFSFWLHALLALAAGTASAQSGSTTDPLDPNARVPAVDYRSPLSTYRPVRDPSVANWKETNEQVGRLGGHVGHTGAGQGSGKPAATPGKDAPRGQQPAATGHGSHR